MPSYKIIKKKGLKRINIRIQPDGTVRVTAPQRTPDYLIKSFINDNRVWINDNVIEKTQYRKITPGLILGELRVDISDQMIGKYNYKASNKTIILNSSLGDQHREILAEFILTKAKSQIPNMVREVANNHGKTIDKVVIKNTKSRWGSCSSKRNINLSKYIWLLPENAKQYVIAHEIAHLYHMNHSKNFWLQVDEMHKDYKASRKILKEHSNLLGCLD